ncbi:bifunctional alpha,alpha-trehalose-phosphate synthase (UDP-forming)/trehalose-phosphatase [Planctomycetota bacterium]
MQRLLIVSNRLPVSVSCNEGQLAYARSVGGVATGLSSLESPVSSHWIGWPGLAEDTLTDTQHHKIDAHLAAEDCSGVHLTHKQVQDYYLGFSNRTIWPLFHYFPTICEFEKSTWQAYKEVNIRFLEQVQQAYQPGDTIWVHDYQLMLLPQLIRQAIPDAAIGFFLHIPFPSFELLRLLPWRLELLEGLLGADLIGFHEYDYVRHFLSSVYRIAGYEHHLSHITYGNRFVRVDAFPMGINYEQFSRCGEDPEVRQATQKLRGQVPEGRKLVVSIDRLDYTKGIVNRLEAYDWFLTTYPEYRGKVTLVVVAVPSRDEVDYYIQLRERLELLIGRINGYHGTIDWTPISYLYRSLPLAELAALYVEADVALITPLRDGMNLVAKEFVATNAHLEQQGVLILSEMAGAANELTEAIVVNPNSKEEIVNALHAALEMPQDQRRRKNDMMLKRLSRYTVGRWATDYLESLADIRREQEGLAMKRLSDRAKTRLVDACRVARSRLLLLDYDGTLVGFFNDPTEASPDERLLQIIATLAQDPHNEVVIISGRDKQTLTRWLGQLPVNLVAEHGAFFRHHGGDWVAKDQLSSDWKQTIRPIMERFVDRTPGSFVEEKSYSLVWHCRRTEPDLAQLRSHELKDALISFTTNMQIGVYEGSKIIEVKNIGINKGAAAETWLAGRHYDFILAAGDDYTDEDMFSVLPDKAYSLKLGQGASQAKYQVDSPDSLRHLLLELSNLAT